MKSLARPFGGWRLLLAALCLLMAALLLPACSEDAGGSASASGSGGVGEDGTGAPVKVASVGMVTGLDEQKVTVNGVEFNHQSAAVQNAQAEPLAAQALAPGMWVAVTGSDAGTGAMPQAETIRILPAARGVVTQIDHDRGTLTLMGATLQANDSTWVTQDAQAIAPGPQLLAGLAVGDLVEVHAPMAAVNGSGTNSASLPSPASRIDKLSAPPATWPYQLKGRITALGRAGLLCIGQQWVDTSEATVVLGRAISVGMTVRVAASTPPSPDHAWRVGRLSADTDALPTRAALLYVEGDVHRLGAGPSFDIDDLPVDASNATGRLGLSADGQRVAAIGPVRDGVLKAKSVSVVAPGAPVTFSLLGTVGGYSSPASFQLKTVTVDASAALYTAGSPAQLGNDAKVWVQGPLQGRVIRATRVRIDSPAPAPTSPAP